MAFPQSPWLFWIHSVSDLLPSSLLHVLFLQMCGNRSAFQADGFPWIWSSRSKLDIIEATGHNSRELMQDKRKLGSGHEEDPRVACGCLVPNQDSQSQQFGCWLDLADTLGISPEDPSLFLGMCLVHRNSKHARSMRNGARGPYHTEEIHTCPAGTWVL